MTEHPEIHPSLDAAQQPGATGDMEQEAFRRYGYQIVDWIADYLTDAGKYLVLSRNTPGEIWYALPASAPVQPESMESIIADFGGRV